MAPPGTSAPPSAAPKQPQGGQAPGQKPTATKPQRAFGSGLGHGNPNSKDKAKKATNVPTNANKAPQPEKAEPTRSKRKMPADGEPAGRQKNKARRATNKAESALKELNSWTNDMNSAPHGADYPSGMVNQNWNNRKNCAIVTYKRNAAGNLLPAVWFGWRLKFCLESQIGGFSILKDGLEIRVGGHNIRKRDVTPIAPSYGDDVFLTTTFNPEDMTPEMIQTSFSDQLETPNMDIVSAQSLAQWGLESLKPSDNGLVALQFVMQKSVKIIYPKDIGIMDESLQDAFNIQAALSDLPICIIVRKPPTVTPQLDNFWKQRARIICQKGIFPFFANFVDVRVDCSFQQWQEQPDMQIPHQPWMVKPQEMGSVATFKTYASHAVHRHFDTPKCWEVIQSVALIQECEYSNMVLNEYFSWGVDHEADVVFRRGKYVQLAISVIKQSSEFTLPEIRVDTRMELQIGDAIMAPGGEAMEEDEPLVTTGDTQMQGLDILAVLKYRCKVVPKETHKSFIVSFMIEKNEFQLFTEGNRMKVQIEMKRNPLPSSRQLYSIGLLASQNIGGRNEHQRVLARSLQTFLLGGGSVDLRDAGLLSAAESKWESLSPEVHTVYGMYVESLGFNALQWAAWESIIMGTSMVNQIQGPPGTGKTALNVIIAICFALLGHRCAITAPTNKACEAGMKSLIGALQSLYAIYPDAKKLFKIVLFPTNSTLKRQFADAEELAKTKPKDSAAPGAPGTSDQADADAEVDAHDAIFENEADNEFKEYKLWHHIERHFYEQTRSNSVTRDKRQDAAKWLAIIYRVRQRTFIQRKEFRMFTEAAEEAIKHILADPLVKIVVSTSNTADILRRNGFECDALIIDECAFGTEQDSCVPLALNAQHIVLTGDHQQLKPFVQSKSRNEYSAQYALSLFERVLGQKDIPLWRLKLNYRMHPDIALLPGMLSYGWLGCGESTVATSDVDTYMEEWWSSASASVYHLARRSPEWKGEARKSIRRLFFNIKDAQSARPVGSTSLVNYANAQVIVDLVVNILEHAHDDVFLSADDITILTPYKAQAEEIQEYISLRMKLLGYTVFPKVVTIKSFQGAENEVILLDLAAADPVHGSRVGFMQEWNRLNVALTRAKRHLFMVGNLDAWRSELQILCEAFHGKNLGFLLIDLLDLGDIIDVKDIENALPADMNELENIHPTEWSRKLPTQCGDIQLGKKLDEKARKYGDPKVRREYEKDLLDALMLKRAKAAQYQAEFDRVGDVKTELFG